EEPTVDVPAVDVTTVDVPAVDASAVDEVVVEEPSVEEPPVEEPITEEPITEELVTEEPPVEELAVEDLVVEEPVGDVPAAEEPAAKQSVFRGITEWVVIIGVALIAAVVIRQFLLQAFYIPSGSMEHTLEIRDRVLVNKLSYRLHDVNRGDIIVFERPAEEGSPSKDLIKRVVGLSGETVEGRDGAVFVNGQRLNEPYLGPGVTSSPFPVQRVPPGHVWMMGDNRSNSRDSRVFGAVPESEVVGRAFIRVFPIKSIRLL
ncbi:MAG TPA: signal peptidase I, partial [Acidimicrobiales bacterium]|nr:signal peptidase I [Acidimicrobiales bacterium]